MTLKQKGSRQRRPQAGREEEVYLNLLRTTEMLSWGISEALKEVELTPTQYNVLRILRGAGEAGASCREIGERMVTKDSDITRLLDRLAGRGLISRARAADDRRVMVVRITDEGLRLLAQLDKPIAGCHQRQLGHLGEKQLAALSKLLKAVHNGPA